MSKYPLIKLGEVATIVSGSTPKTNVSEYWDGEYNWVTPAELNDDVHVIYETERKISEKAVVDTGLKLLPKGTVLLSSRAPIGKVAIAGTEMYCNQGFKNLICSDRIYNKYLFWFLKGKTDYLNSLGRGATFKEISKAIVEKMQIPLPPLETQKQIAKTLDTVSELLSLRKQQLAELDNLSKSIFYEMFGDPATNEKGYEVKTICEIAEGKLTYGSGASAVPYNGVTRYIRITDINDDGTLNEDIVSPSVVDERYLLNDGDILFARSGATAGKAFRFRSNYGNCIYAGYLIRLKPNKNLVHPDFIYSFTKTKYYQDFIESNKKVVAQPNINAQQYGKLAIYVPPLAKQLQFASIVTKIEEQKQFVKKSIQETQLLFDSLMSQYFDE